MGSGSRVPEVRTVHIFLGFFFVVNFCVGTGFLGVPFSFFYSGYLAAVPTLLLIFFISWLNGNYLLEVMARAQALEYFENAQKPSGLDSDDYDSFLVNTGAKKHPIFEITVRRKFEVVELCEIFFNKWAKYLYLIILIIYSLLAAWSLATVAGSSWALNIPYNFSGVEMCEGDPFHHRVLPVGEPCRNAYYFSLFLYAIIVVVLSLLDLKEQAIIQMILGLMRFLTVGAIVVYSLAKVAEGGDVCERPEDAVGSGTVGSGNVPWTLLENGTRYTSYEEIIVKFETENWLAAIPILTYAFIMHQGISSLTHPIRQKRYLGQLMMAMFGVSVFCYMILGVAAPLWFKSSVQETVTLNFNDLKSSPHSWALRMLAYYLLLFPSLDVVSAFPLVVHTVVNNLYLIITGHDTSQPPLPRHKLMDRILRFCLRLIVAILPVLLAFGMANLVYVLKYAGLVGFNICFFFPTVLQLRSIYICRQKFAPNHISIAGSHSDEEHQSLLSADGASITANNQPLLTTKHAKGKEGRLRYMTPYSIAVLSHPITVVIVGVIGVCFFILTLASLGVHPTKMTCDDLT